MRADAGLPHVPNAPGIYRLTLLGADGRCTGIYVGETDRLPRRFQHYRTPGADERPTMFRLNRLLEQALTEGGRVDVEVITRAEITIGAALPVPLDLTQKAGRVLVERAAEVSHRAEGDPMLNK